MGSIFIFMFRNGFLWLGGCWVTSSFFPAITLSIYILFFKQ